MDEAVPSQRMSRRAWYYLQVSTSLEQDFVIFGQIWANLKFIVARPANYNGLKVHLLNFDIVILLKQMAFY